MANDCADMLETVERSNARFGGIGSRHRRGAGAGQVGRVDGIGSLAHQAVVNIEIGLATDGNICIVVVTICHDLERVDHGSIGRVFEGHHTACSLSGVNRNKNISATQSAGLCAHGAGLGTFNGHGRFADISIGFEDTKGRLSKTGSCQSIEIAFIKSARVYLMSI